MRRRERRGGVVKLRANDAGTLFLSSWILATKKASWCVSFPASSTKRNANKQIVKDRSAKRKTCTHVQ